LKQSERDELLLRLDERVRDLKESDVPEIKLHLSKINGTLLKHSDDISALKITTYGKNGDEGLCGIVRNNRGWIIKLVIIVAFISALIGGGISDLFMKFF
jgi:hypothetical protein